MGSFYYPREITMTAPLIDSTRIIGARQFLLRFCRRSDLVYFGQMTGF